MTDEWSHVVSAWLLWMSPLFGWNISFLYVWHKEMFTGWMWSEGNGLLTVSWDRSRCRSCSYTIVCTCSTNGRIRIQNESVGLEPPQIKRTIYRTFFFTRILVSAEFSLNSSSFSLKQLFCPQWEFCCFLVDKVHGEYSEKTLVVLKNSFRSFRGREKNVVFSS